MVKHEWKTREKSEIIDYNGIRYYRYPDSKSHGKRCYYTCSNENKKKGYSTLHRDIWRYEHNAEIPKGYDIHHKDGNYLNNDIKNLELITRSEHAKEHWKMQTEEKRIQALHAIKNAQKRNKELCKDVNYRKILSERAKKRAENNQFDCVCNVCGKQFISHVEKAKYCCKECKRVASNKLATERRKAYYEKRQCIVCKKEFLCNRYNKITQTCSPHCKNIKRGWTIHSI